MGYVTCSPSNHSYLHAREVRCCWRCDRCPKEAGFRLRKGDYCPDCVKAMKAEGLVYSAYFNDYVTPERAAEAIVRWAEFKAAHPEIVVANGGAV
jgi:hypothetical protein